MASEIIETSNKAAVSNKNRNWNALDSKDGRLSINYEFGHNLNSVVNEDVQGRQSVKNLLSLFCPTPTNAVNPIDAN